MARIRSVLKYYYHKLYQKFHYDTFKVLVNIGRMQAEANASKNIERLEQAEFQVFSQRGEDGILQYIISKIEIPNKIFIEFGVENYTESNTRFLLINNNWSGLVIDGDKDNIRFIRSDYIYWKYDLTAMHSFIRKDNINRLIGRFLQSGNMHRGLAGDIGLLSVDIDGNDYWIWEAIDTIRPRIVVCEYNSAFGSTLKVSIPYAPDFYRTAAHYSNLYFGASLAAFCHLAEQKGYDFIGTAGAGVNAFFVRKDLSDPFKKCSPGTDFRESANRDSRTKKGRNSFLPHAERLPLIRDLPLVDVVTGESYLIKDLYKL
ncbi:MAG: hypothetical protein P4L51_08065 [Puia sp.]|nr:hypothetical protein [Puia sp.]